MMDNYNLKKDLVIDFFSRNKKYSIIAIFVAIIILTLALITNSIKNDKQRKISTLLAEVVNKNKDISEFRNLKENKNTHQIINLSKMIDANQFLEKQDYNKAVDIYLKIHRDVNTNKFVKEISGLYAITIIINHRLKGNDIISILDEMIKNSTIFYYFLLEQKAIYFYLEDKLLDSKNIFENLSKNPESSVLIKERSDMMIKIIEDKLNS